MNDAITRLLFHADDYETDIIVNLMLKSGMLWRCDCQPGNWDNDEEETACGRCGRPREQKEAE